MEEIGQLLSYLGLHVFLTAFETHAVSAATNVYAAAVCLVQLTIIWLQIDGSTLRDMGMEDLSDIAPDATRVECKLLVRSIRDIEIKYHGDPSVTPVEAFDASATSSFGADNDVIGQRSFACMACSIHKPY